MKHLGDITKISGYTVPVVDCVIGGSPCQDLSVAGKRAGLDGERSGLYMEQIRIVKEMRDRDRKMGRSGVDIRPRYMVWENVPGAFSSNKGEDFRIVLEEIAKVSDENAVIPIPNKGKWTNHGCIVGNGWSVAWRVLDAQFWGVPQRRRRIALVADFGGESASEILFVRKSVSGNTEQSKSQRQGTSSDVKGSTGADDSEGAVPYTLKIRSGCEGGGKGALIQTDRSATLSTLQDQTLFQPVGCDIYNTTLTGDKVCSLTAGGYTSTGSCPKVITVDQGGGKSTCNVQEGQAPTLTCTHGGEPVVCYSIENYPADSRVDIDEGGVVQMREGKERDVVAVKVGTRYIVRRLTPLECERLQGYPDGWTDIGDYIDSNGKKKQSSDAARYKSLGNSIALPPWKWVLKRMCACYERDATMASLFDGIGGFPYLWEQLNGKGTCLWASEIEEFPMAVTKVRIGDD